MCGRPKSEQPRSRTSIQYIPCKQDGTLVNVCAKTFSSIMTIDMYFLNILYLYYHSSYCTVCKRIFLCLTGRKCSNWISCEFLETGIPSKEKICGSRCTEQQERTHQWMNYFVTCHLFTYTIHRWYSDGSLKEHLDYVRQVLARLAMVGLILSVDKCVFAQDSVEFLGYTVTSTGICVTRILKFKRPNMLLVSKDFSGW